MADVNALAEQLVNLTVKEVSDLAEVLKTEYGIEPAASAPVMVAGAAGDEAGGGEAVAEQTEFDVILNAPGGAKLQVVKAVKALTGLGLKEAKDMVDNTPSTVKEKVSKEEAEEVKGKLEEAGAEVELK